MKHGMRDMVKIEGWVWANSQVQGSYFNVTLYNVVDKIQMIFEKKYINEMKKNIT